MSRDEEDKSPRLFDSRTIERNIRKGLITRKDYDKYLKSLPDVTDKIAPADAPRTVGGVPGAAMSMDDDEDDLDDLDADLEDEDTEEVTVGTAVGAQPEGAADDDTVADDDADADDDLDDEDDDEDMDDDTTAGDETPKA